MNKDLRQRTDGEELWLYRKHKGLKQEELAVKLGVGRTTYWKMETDQIPFVHLPHYKLWGTKLEPYLLLMLARRRAAWSLRRTAKKAGISHVALLKREREGSAWLVAWWRARGFSF